MSGNGKIYMWSVYGEYVRLCRNCVESVWLRVESVCKVECMECLLLYVLATSKIIAGRWRVCVKLYVRSVYMGGGCAYM